MRFTTDRCLGCGLPTSERFKTIGDFWFHSIDCYFDEIDKLVPKEYRQEIDPWHSKEVQDYLKSDDRHPPEYESVHAYADALEKKFIDKRAELFEDAKNTLHKRIEAEARHYRSQQEEKDRIVREKEEEKLEKQRLKEDEEEAERDAYEQMLEEQDIPYKIRYEHTHILGPQGTGKTTLLEHLFLEDHNEDFDILDAALYAGKQVVGFPSYIIIDPKGLMVERIARLREFNPDNGDFRDRIIIIDPADAPALNMFRIDRSRFTEEQQTAYLNNIIETFSYIFSTAKSPLTPRQSVPFRFVVRLVFWMDGDLRTLLDILEDDAKIRAFKPVMDKFAASDETGMAARFFNNDFYSTSFAATKEQIRTRLLEVLGRPEIARMFLATENKIDFFDIIQNGTTILVNTGLSYLGPSGSSFIGRYVIAMAMNAVLARAYIPKKEWNSVYLMCDEFQDFADEEGTPRLLRLVREYKMGVVMAHQAMHCNELNDALRTSISTSAIKYCASPAASDLPYMAKDLHCDPEFLRKQQPHGTNINFACYVRGMNLKHPFQIKLNVGRVECEPQMTESQYRSLRARNRVALSPKSPKQEVRRAIPDTDEATREWEQQQIDDYGYLPDDDDETYEEPTEAEPPRIHVHPPAEPNKPILPQNESDPNKPGKWTRK